MRRDPRCRSDKPKHKSGPRAPVAGLDRARAEAEAARLPDAELQNLLNAYRAGDDSAHAKLQNALTYLTFEACDNLDTSFAFDEISTHMLALATCLDRLRANEVTADDLPRYIRNEMWSGRKEDRTKHRVQIPRRERQAFDDDAECHDSSPLEWLDIDLDKLGESDREIAKLYIVERRQQREVANILGLTVHAVRQGLERIKRAAA
jgi:RNA polymerase sigma factor (sigma-70 family)